MDEPEPPRRVETADFAPIRIAGPGRPARAPLIVGAWLVVVGAVVALGTLGRSAAMDAAPQAARATADPAAMGATTATMTLDPILAPRPPASDPEPLAINVRATAGGLSVRGTVLVRSVTSVAIRVVDEGGSEVAARSVSVEDPDGGIRPAHQPAFALLIGLSDTALQSAYVVEVDAYDGLGAPLGYALQWLGPTNATCGSGRDCSSG